MTVDLNEPAVSALKQRLDDDLATHIAAINAGVTDGFTIAEPQQVLDHVPTPALLTTFPTVGIGDGRTTFEDDLGHSATGRHELLVCAFVQDADQQALAWRLRRYGQAIVRTILADRNLGSGAWGSGLIGVYPGPALADSEDPQQVSEWMSWIGVRIWTRDDQDA